jgi:hypothetical protein
MDAIIGRYRVRMEEGTGLVLRHATGINFDLNPGETIGLFRFLNAYRENLAAMEREMERETEPHLKRIALERVEKGDE